LHISAYILQRASIPVICVLNLSVTNIFSGRTNAYIAEIAHILVTYVINLSVRSAI